MQTKVFIITILCALAACSPLKMGLDKPIEADLLALEYALDKQKADKKYKDEFLTVYGQLWQSYTNKFNENIIILMSKDKKYGVKCTLSSSVKPIGRPLKQGEILKLNGKCLGYEDYVILKGCIILKN